MQTCLFLCTGNYYRSRFAEIYFNTLAQRAGVSWRGDSRGLHISGLNPGPISQSTLAWLRKLDIEPPSAAITRMPILVQEADLRSATRVIAVKESEHRPLLDKNHPGWSDRVEFWLIHDQDVAQPHEAIPVLVRHVEALFLRLTGKPSSAIN